jgi:hypothetical protein
MLNTIDRTLLDGEEFKALVRRGLKPGDADLAGLSVLAAPGRRIKTVSDPALRRVAYVISDDTVDRAGDVIVQTGWNLAGFLQNPVVCLNHDTHNGLPIAKALSVTPEQHRTTSIAEFASAETYPLADTVYRLATGGFMNAASVGFAPEEWEESDSGIRYLKSALLEWSCVNIPCNANALMSARSKGISLEPLVGWATETLDRFASAKGATAKRLRGEIDLLRISASPTQSRSVPVKRQKRQAKDAPLALPTDVPAADPMETALASCTTLLSEAGTCCSIVASSIQALRSTPPPGAADEDAQLTRQAELDAISVNATACAAAMTTIASLSVGVGAKKPKSAAVLVDGKEIESVDDVLAGLEDITPKELADIISRSIVESMTGVTGKVW